MLRRLRIRDFAIIDSLEIQFEGGLTVLTGETGAGKSIVVDALGLSLGERAQTDAVRTGRSESAVEAYFDVPQQPLIEDLGIPQEDGIILRRAVSVQGKSKAFINDTMVSVQSLFELGKALVDLHGQHEHQSLLSPDRQRTILDAYGRLEGKVEEVGALYREARSLEESVAALKAGIKEREQRRDFLTFQIREIEGASLVRGEKEAIAGERTILMNLTRLNELTDAAYCLLYSNDGSVVGQVAAVVSMLREIAVIDHGAQEILGLVESAQPLLEDAAASVRGFRDRYDLEPGRLDAVEERLELIKRLERKYGEGIEEILSYRDRAATELEGLASSDERVRSLEQELSARQEKLTACAEALSSLRGEVSKRIEASVRTVLRDLAMENAEFSIEIVPSPLSSTGKDEVRFLFSANKGEPVKPLSKTASGGELSRVMLALKETLAEVDRIPVLIFDEVDAGIGGKTAESVGRRLRKLARRHQVLCVTHLPQIAAMADNHIVIEKTQGEEGVRVRVKDVASGEREKEIARMLSGRITEISLRHARELLSRVA